MTAAALQGLRRPSSQPKDTTKEQAPRGTEGMTWRPLQRTGKVVGQDIPSNRQEKGF